VVKATFLNRLIYKARDFASRRMFAEMRRYCHGSVLDVGGASFIVTAKAKKIRYETWTTLEVVEGSKPQVNDPNFRLVIGDGCAMPFANGQFDVVLNIQVLEHTFEPFTMFKEIVRVLKPGGRAIFLIPQTATIHLAPHHYQNFMRYWIIEACRRTGCTIVKLQPMGGWWSSLASRCIYFFWTVFRKAGNSRTEYKRNWLFYFLFHFMALYTVLSFPIYLLFSLGDLTEEPNNHLVVIRKPLEQAMVDHTARPLGAQ
jgi:SAM-dependent methyltransferase